VQKVAWPISGGFMESDLARPVRFTLLGTLAKFDYLWRVPNQIAGVFGGGPLSFV